MDQQLSAPGLTASAPGGYVLDYDGEANDFAGIVIRNSILSLLTLGVYRFWGKTQIRRYLWNHITFEGDRLEYTGRGLELFIGFMIVSVFLIVIYAAILLAGFGLQMTEVGFEGLELGFLIFLVLLVPVAIYRARRYKLSRTVWRGIRAGQSGSAFKYAVLSVGVYLLLIPTLGLAYPFARAVLERYRMRHTWFGDQCFEFEARPGRLFGRWLLTLLLLPFTFGLSYYWYRVGEFRYFVSCSGFMGARFSSSLDTGRVIGFALLTLIARIIFGFVLFGLAGLLAFILAPDQLDNLGNAAGDPLAHASPIIYLFALAGVVGILGFAVIDAVFFLQPLIAEAIRSLKVEGEIDFEALAQSALRAPGSGEGLADAFDLSPV